MSARTLVLAALVLSRDDDEWASLYVAAYATVGRPLGALTGLALPPAERWKELPLPPRRPTAARPLAFAVTLGF